MRILKNANWTKMIIFLRMHLCTVKARVHNVQTGTHISGYRSYSEQATDFKLLTDILDT